MSPNNSAVWSEFRSDITRFLGHSFVRVMVRLAQGLPVGPVPEQEVVTTVRLDVIDHIGGSNSAFISAHHAKWMRP
jgi:hypothetical protein